MAMRGGGSFQEGRRVRNWLQARNDGCSPSRRFKIIMGNRPCPLRTFRCPYIFHPLREPRESWFFHTALRRPVPPGIVRPRPAPAWSKSLLQPGKVSLFCSGWRLLPGLLQPAVALAWSCSRSRSCQPCVPGWLLLLPPATPGMVGRPAPAWARGCCSWQGIPFLQPYALCGLGLGAGQARLVGRAAAVLTGAAAEPSRDERATGPGSSGPVLSGCCGWPSGAACGCRLPPSGRLWPFALLPPLHAILSFREPPGSPPASTGEGEAICYG